MLDAKWCNNNINSGKFTFKSIVDEFKELIEANTWKEVKEEFGDVLYFMYCWLYYKFKINLPMFGARASVIKFTERLYWWETLFKSLGLDFHPKYLVNGSNYLKMEKIVSAVELAREEQGKNANS